MPHNNYYSEYIHDAVIALRQYMDTHPMMHRTCDELWDVYKDTTRSTIEKAFKDITGYRIKEYLVRVRLEQSPTDWLKERRLQRR